MRLRELIKKQRDWLIEEIPRNLILLIVALPTSIAAVATAFVDSWRTAFWVWLGDEVEIFRITLVLLFIVAVVLGVCVWVLFRKFKLLSSTVKELAVRVEVLEGPPASG